MLYVGCLNQSDMKILINTPDWRKPYLGGVANHYHGLKPFWSQDVRYNIVGSRGKAGLGFLYLPFDVLRYIYILLVWKPDLVVLNPSLAPNAMKRDSLFLKIASLFKRKSIVFFHGFNLSYAEKIDEKQFCSMFSKADSFVVLAEKFKDYLMRWGMVQPIYTATTKVDDRLIETFDVGIRTGKVDTILLLSRIEKSKGIYEAVDTFTFLQKQYPDLKMRIVGDGSELNKLKEYVDKLKLNNVFFTGMLSGETLINQFISADLYFFPSYHEGMPTTVLEAMAFGLPIITRPVGGLVDFFENGKMGEMIDSLEAKDFAKSIQHYIEDPTLTKSTSLYNYQYAKMHFYASTVAEKMEKICLMVIDG